MKLGGEISAVSTTVLRTLAEKTEAYSTKLYEPHLDPVETYIIFQCFMKDTPHNNTLFFKLPLHDDCIAQGNSGMIPAFPNELILFSFPSVPCSLRQCF